MATPWRLRQALTLAAFWLFLAQAHVARAATAGGGGGEAMPWEGPLNKVLASFTGPVAKALCILAIVVTGFAFAFSDGGGMRRIGHPAGGSNETAGKRTRLIVLVPVMARPGSTRVRLARRWRGCW